MTANGHKWRLLTLLVIFCGLFIALLWRMYDLTILNQKFLKFQGDARSIRLVKIPATRGIILDREGHPLAVSTPIKSVWINPKEFQTNDGKLLELAKLLKQSPSSIIKRTNFAKNKEFLYLKRHISPRLAKKIEKLKIPGVNFLEEYKRYYPEGESASQLIGFTDIDDNGIEGLEYAFQSWLKGSEGKKRVVKDRLGRVIEVLDILKEPKPGKNLQLSIDRRIQYYAFKELSKVINKYKADSGSVVVLDAKSGEVLAIVNAPSFNPNNRGKYSSERYRNKAITDTFEPGSVIKPLSIASALESGKFTPDTPIDTTPSMMVINGNIIRDVHSYGDLDVRGVLRRSSNVGVSKMVLANPKEQLLDLYKRVGIGSKAGVGYPSEAEGSLTWIRDANPFVLATLGFGYGLALSPLQLAKSYLIFANDGNMLPVSLLHYEDSPVGKQIISKKTAREMLDMMEEVVQEGTGRNAKVPGFRIAGKTGTARVAGDNGYEKNRHIASFVGVAPVSSPKLIIAVVINEPHAISYYGGAVAAPLFADIMGASLRILDIEPDQKGTL